MTIQNYLFICCVGGSLTGSFIRWFYPCIFKEQQKRAEFTALNMLPTLVVGACLGLSVAVFFNSDISHFEEVHATYIEKLGLISAAFTMPVIDRLDKHLINRVDRYLNTTSHK